MASRNRFEGSALGIHFGKWIDILDFGDPLEALAAVKNMRKALAEVEEGLIIESVNDGATHAEVAARLGVTRQAISDRLNRVSASARTTNPSHIYKHFIATAETVVRPQRDAQGRSNAANFARYYEEQRRKEQGRKEQGRKKS